MGERSFSVVFPRIYRLSRLQNSSIDSLAIPNTFPVSWNFGFKRNLNDGEALEVSSLLECLEGVKLTVSKNDVRRWILDASGDFSCKSFRNFLTKDNAINFDLASIIWKSKAPPKVKFLGWLVAHNRLNTCDMLQRRRPNRCFSPHWCIMCKSNGENANHLFLHCEVAAFLWQKLFREAGLLWDSPTQVSVLFSQNHFGFGKGKKAKILWGCGVLAVFWVLWSERNRRIFEVYEGIGVGFLWERVRFWVAFWASTSEAFKDYSFSCILRDWRAAVV